MAATYRRSKTLFCLSFKRLQKWFALAINVSQQWLHSSEQNFTLLPSVEEHLHRNSLFMFQIN
jgi:hypothetical protein